MLDDQETTGTSTVTQLQAHRALLSQIIGDGIARSPNLIVKEGHETP